MPEIDPTKPEQEKKRGNPNWVKGVSANPAGRKKGSKNKLSEDFVAALHADFSEHGSAAIVATRTERPNEYLKIIASILPKDVNLNVNEYDDLTDEQLIERIRSLESAFAEAVALGVGASQAGANSTDGNEQASDVPPVH
jgi:hypothetical protein